MIQVEEKLLETLDLRTILNVDEGKLIVVDGVDISVNRGETLGIVGESGCGKSMLAQSILRIEPKYAKISGEINLYSKFGDRINLASYVRNSVNLRKVRGGRVSMIFQEPMSAFSVLHTIGNQLKEAIYLHRATKEIEAEKIAVRALERVGIPNPRQRLKDYPHHFSGGMRQRAMIAMALSCEPELLIADEPTTALDVTIQAQILSLMKELQNETGMAIIYISHDLGVIANMVDKVIVMYLGKIVERSSVNNLFANPLHPYTKALINSIPRIGKTKREKLFSIKGVVPSPLENRIGCDFYSRCEKAINNICNKKVPNLSEINKDHEVRCFLYK